MTADHINHADRTDNGEHAIIAVEHVTFGYKKKQTVLEDIDFTVPQGQSLAILGYNGVGKTTLFRLIVGLLRPREGRCVIDRRRVPSMRDVFQMTENGNLVGTMTVRDNIHFRQLLFRSGKGITAARPCLRIGGASRQEGGGTLDRSAQTGRHRRRHAVRPACHHARRAKQRH